MEKPDWMKILHKKFDEIDEKLGRNRVRWKKTHERLP